MNQGIEIIVYPVSDIGRAKALFSKLMGVEPYADAPYYVGYMVGDDQLGLDPNGHKQGLTGPVGYWKVDDIKATVQSLVDAGAEIQQEINDVGAGKLMARLKDADGNIIGLTSA